MLALTQYPPVPSTHPWFRVEQQRAECLLLWQHGHVAQANQQFVAAIRADPQCPFAWPSYHRFLHDQQGAGGLPKDAIVRVPQTPHCSSFALYRFFNRCQVATAVAARGWNGFEPPCPLVVAKWIRALGGTFIDVGANSGYYSLLAIAAGARHSLAYEPFAPAADVLRSNIELNNWTARIAVRQAAVADQAGVIPFFLPLQEHGLLETSASQDPTFRASHSFRFDATVITLDSLLNELPVLEPLTIKIDVEGVGPTAAVLNGGRHLARERRPLLMVEYLEGPVNDLHRFRNDLAYTSIVCKPNGQAFVERHVTPQGDQLNHYFVPNERLDNFARVLAM